MQIILGLAPTPVVGVNEKPNGLPTLPGVCIVADG